MGNVYKSSYTATLPAGAVVKGTTVTWTTKRGKKQTGKLTANNRVLIETGKWIAEWTDETGKEHKESTGCTSKDAALHFLRHKELEVERIRAGILSREEITQSTQAQIPIALHLDAFHASRKATDVGLRQIDDVNKKLKDIFDFINVIYLDELKTEHFEKYIVFRKENRMTPRTINHDIAALKTFFKWCLSTRRMTDSPVKSIKKLSTASGCETNRRAFTEDELSRIFVAARTRKNRGEKRCYEVEMIYRTLLGTGLRSSEIASIKVNQVTLTHIILEAPSEKNRKGTYQPITQGLSQLLQNWINDSEKKPGDALFVCTKKSIHDAFVGDCLAAKIERIDDRGHILVPYSFRHTFGTRLARAGVPLTTTQRLMRHSSPELTAKYYIDVTPIEMIDALEKIERLF